MQGPKFISVATVIGLLAFSEPAWARRQNREGFNFGTTVRVLGGDERTTAGEGSDRNTKVTSSSQSVNPYVGWAFEYINLGLVFSAQSQESQTVENTTDGQTSFERSTSLDGKGLAFFMRFMFGGYFFFEGAGGVYQEKLHVSTETKHATTGDSFTGEHSEYEVNGTGPGYHVAGGLELPMGSGFVFTSAYQTRVVQLRDYNGGSDLGKKRSKSQKRELLFGIAHYLQ